MHVTFAKDQPEYQPLPVAIHDATGYPGHIAVTSEYVLSDEERRLVMAGGRLRLEQLTFGQPLQPVRLSIEPAQHELSRPRLIDHHPV